MNRLVKGRTGMRSAERSVVPAPVKALSTLFLDRSEVKENLSTVNNTMALEFHVHVSARHAQLEYLISFGQIYSFSFISDCQRAERNGKKTVQLPRNNSGSTQNFKKQKQNINFT